MARKGDLGRLRVARLLGLVLYILTLVGLLVILDGLEESSLPFPADLALFVVASVAAGVLLGPVALLGPVGFVAGCFALYANGVNLTFFEDALWAIAVLVLMAIQLGAVAAGLVVRGLLRSVRSGS